MSQNPRSRFRFNPIRTYRLYWCFQCQRTVRIVSLSPSEIFCPRCFGQFLHETDFARPRLVVDLANLDAPRSDRLLDALSLHFAPLIWPHNSELDNPRRNPFLDYVPGTLPDRLVLIRPARPHQTPWPTAAAPAPAESSASSPAPPVNPRDYFVGPGLNDLIDELTQNDRPGPPPAPTCAIDALPTVKITSDNMLDGPHCPVCKDEFEIGGEAREMPCKHVYHSDCIVPWLRLHNSCPVCRHELSAPNEDDAQDQCEDAAVRGVERRRRGRWNPFSLLWPFQSPSSRRSRYRVRLDDGTSNSREDLAYSHFRVGKQFISIDSVVVQILHVPALDGIGIPES
ncbi:hypothetical protein ACLOJK_013791 [Asimina triloba]